jgi:glutamate/tyrosine decarboxylase-like PLP-dependent enzyme
MDTASLPDLLDRVKEILQSQNRRPDSFGTYNSHISAVTNKPSARVLPVSVPQLPDTVVTLPSSLLPDPLDNIVSLLSTHVLPNLNLASLSPRYYGFVIGGVTPAALIADILASIYDQNVHVHLPHETISTTIEVASLNLLVDLFNLPKSEWAVGLKGCNGGGVITTGATASNILGLALGREYVLTQAVRRVTNQQLSCGDKGLLEMARLGQIDRICVLSTLPHSSIAKAASVVGIGRSSVDDISNGQNGSLNIDIDKLLHLASNAQKDRTAYILAISAGEVNTGHFSTTGLSEMKQIRQICTDHSIWIHVDGAFGLFTRVLMSSPGSKSPLPSEEGEEDPHEDLIRGVQGLELADSITGDGHKLLNVPYDCGIFFTRHKKLSEDVFQNGNAAYLTAGPQNHDIDRSGGGGGGGPEIQSPLNIGLENSKRFRALPVYATLMAYGREGYVDMLTRQIGLARRVVRWMWDQPGLEVLPRMATLKEVVAKTFIVVLFRAKDESLNVDLVKRINADGRIYVTGTKWDGRSAARIAVSNWQADVERDGRIIERVIGDVLAQGVKPEA